MNCWSPQNPATGGVEWLIFVSNMYSTWIYTFELSNDRAQLWSIGVGELCLAEFTMGEFRAVCKLKILTKENS